MDKRTIRQILICIGAVGGGILFSAAAKNKQSYKDSSLSPAVRAELLLKEMTLEEKVGQMCQYVGPGYQNNQKTGSSTGNIDADVLNFGLKSRAIAEKIRKGEIGSFLHVMTVGEANALQQVARQSRLGIPLLIGIDAIHGNGLHYGATIYPTSIGMASTFNPELLEQSGLETAREMRASGMHWAFNPNLDVARDARWGRMGETFGEDTYLVGCMGTALIKGLQGKNGVESDRVLACAKHFIGGGEPAGGNNGAPMDMSEQKLREVFLPPFIAAIQAKAYSFMAAHNELNGIPCHGNRWLLTDLLRGELGFDGFVVSDWMDIERMYSMHRYVPSEQEACLVAVEAGIDMHMHGTKFFESILEGVRSGRIHEERIDQGVRKILEAKFLLGLFEEPLVDLLESAKQIGTSEHRHTALEAARQSVVLLKNDGVLPLQEGQYRKIFVTGPNADSQAILGDWAFRQPDDNIITVVEGIQALGQGLIIDTLCFSGNPLTMKESLIEKAALKAKEADVNIVVVGENSLRYVNYHTCGENLDRDNLLLPGRQQELLEKVWASGKPTILVLVNGRSLNLCWASEHVSAILEAWEPGMMGGRAIAEILFGKINPSAKLPVSIPRNVGQIQTIYNHKTSQYSRRFALTKTGALYPFGFGLSYTTFSYGKPVLSKRKIRLNESLTVSFDLTNTGKVGGTEIAQLYIRDDYASVTRPVKELRGFRRVYLKPGETQKIEFTITPDDLKLYTAGKKWEVEPGTFTIMTGGSSADRDLQKVTLTVVEK